MAKSQKQPERIGYVPVQNPYSAWRGFAGDTVGLLGTGASLNLGGLGAHRGVSSALRAKTRKGAILKGGLAAASGLAGLGGTLGSLHLRSKLSRGTHVFARNNSPETQAKWRKVYRDRGQGNFSHFQYVAEFRASQPRKPQNNGYMVVQSPDSPLRKLGVGALGLGSLGVTGTGVFKALGRRKLLGAGLIGAGLYGLHRTARAQGKEGLYLPGNSLQTQEKWRNRWKARGYHD